MRKTNKKQRKRTEKSLEQRFSDKSILFYSCHLNRKNLKFFLNTHNSKKLLLN